MKETELSKLKLDNKMDILTAIELLEHILYDGWACEKCGIIQGEPRKGFKKYYCQCITNKINRRLLQIKKKITQNILKHTVKKLKNDASLEESEPR